MGFRFGLLVGVVLLVLFSAAPVAAQQAEADVFVAQAVLAFEERRYEEALAHLREALALEPLEPSRVLLQPRGVLADPVLAVLRG